ncbi:Protein O-linked-mannose beta-1,4-N-acetylglucosaminyltransferase 2 [Quillaja saponaria]|uniref:Protein O-linked-mannose beta-1,4-N-acetylglucosaminyltransferase 2 n=1 Tax=Quillaja saponaria TaxID=32244 RepID=A0AAD7Q5B4_QUISA|nr:Protein O-linked-mannose beta-1,4-N-acetylglucosaminyltransferase 2 [Quillaja saponaria]
MMYDTFLARSFSRHEQKKLGFGAFVCCLIIALSFCTVFRSYLGPLPNLKLRLSVGIHHKLLIVRGTSSINENEITSPQIDKEGEIVTEKVVHTSSSTENVTSSPQKDKDEEIGTKKVEHTTSSTENEITSPQIDKDEEIATKKVEHTTSSTENEITSPQIDKDEEIVTEKVEHTSSTTENEITSPQIDKDEETITEKVEPLCTTEERTEFCEIEGDVIVHGNTSSVYSVTGQLSILAENASWSVRPYARREDTTAMSRVREWTVKPVKESQEIPQCTKNHSIPAVLFSLAGYAGNHFHDFTDVVIPLFLTSRKFNGEVQFLITDKRSWWISKFQAVLNGLSKYELIDIDTDNEVHCFPTVIVGLKRYHKELTIDPLKYSYSMKDFKDFLRSSFSLKRAKAIKIRDGQQKKPRLLIISRKRTRSFTNTGQIGKLAKSLGYKVVTVEAENLSSFAEIVNSCDVLMGVHGAGLTNIVFLPENAIFIQVVPYGGVEWLATNDFAEPSKDMNLKYLEYKIRMEESTLIQQYPPDHDVLKDPPSIQRQGWEAFRSVYLDKQNVKLDINRFRPTLLKALELLHQ